MKKHLSRIICLLLLFFGLSPWITQLTEGHDYVELIFIFIVLLLFSVREKIKIFKYLVFLFPLLYVIFSPRRPQSIFKLNELDIYDVNQRRQYYPISVARIFENKLVRYFYYYENSFFQATDFNYYFFNNHPRERAATKETEKAIYFFLPFFIIGLFFSLINKNYFWLLYFIFTLSIISFYNPIDPLAFLVFPFFAVNIYFGCRYLFKRLNLIF